MVLISDLIKKAKTGDKESMELLIIKFNPIINSLSWKMKNEFGRTDLTIFLMNLIYEINLTHVLNSSDGALINYIKKALYREYYRINKTSSINEVELIDIITECNNDYDYVEDKVFLDQLVCQKIINKNQKYLLIKKYYGGFTDQEISKNLSISRQAVSKMHKVAIKNLRTYMS
ncbi:MAG: helix-turn-helix domain-containing protein [Clostridiaceae bacterium]